MASPGSVPRRTLRRRRRRAGRSGPLLLRGGGGRGLGDRQLRRHVASDLRRRADRVNWGHRGGPSNPQVIYVGTGEADIRTDISYGDGVYRSDDGGKTWRHLGLDDTRRIGRIVIDPQNPERVWVAALGHAFGPNEQRGVFRSADGGRTWQKVLYRDENTGAIDLALDPSSANTIYAALWAGRRPPWNVYPPSNGYGAVYKSTDGGNTWQTLGGGSPEARASAGSASPSRLPSPNGSTPRSTRRRAACTAPTTGARAGRSWPTRTGYGTAAGTSGASPWTRSTRTSSTS